MFAAKNTDLTLLLPIFSVQIRSSDARGEPVQSEIRLVWSAEICHFEHEIQSFANWCAANPWLRRDFEIMVAIANEVFGADSHWIEERPAYRHALALVPCEQGWG